MNNTQSPSSIKFIVPIDLEALRVAPSSVEKAKTSVYDFSALGQHPTSGLGNLIAANRFQDAEMSLNQNPGVNLHWTLPRAYTHGMQNQKTGTVEFPMMPNRWLVIRFFKDNQKQTNNTRIRIWILESDAHSGNSGEVGDSQTTIPWMNNAADLQGIEPNFIGKKIDFTGSWTEPGAGGGGVSYLGGQFQAPFGYGETFTAYYQNCDNILGLNDDFSDYFPHLNGLEDNSNFTASYAVMGWVSSPAADECNIILNEGLQEYNGMTGTKPSFADFIQQVIEQRLEWSLDDYSSLTVDNAGNVQAVMGGVLADLEWKIKGPGDPTYPTKIPSSDGVQVAIGNNTAQALSAYIDAIEKAAIAEGDNGVTSNLEWLLDALQFNQLHKLAAGDQGVGQLEEYMHGTNFASDPGGYLWTVRLQMKPDQPQNPAADINVTLPVYIAKILSELNELQQALDNTRNEITSRRKQTFFDWTYHITNLDTKVIHGSSSFSEDDSGNFLMDGMLQMYPFLLKAGNFFETGSPVAPYQPKADAFSILAPTGQIPNLPNYVFNSENNQPAGDLVQSLLAFGSGVDEIGDGDLPDAASRLSQALSLLRLYQAGGAQANNYLKLADEQVAESLAELKKAETKIGALKDPGSGLASAKTKVDDSQNTLNGYIDPTTGVFATALKYTADPGKAPLPAGETYHGALQGSTLTPLNSWDAPVNTFPGMKAQLDIFSGQNGRPQHLFDIHEAALYLGLAYFYFKSGVPFKCSSAYYLQMSEQTIKDASSLSSKASSALEEAISALNGSVLSNMYNSLQQIITADIPKIQADIKDASDPAIADAITQLESLLEQSLPALQAVILSPDWQILESGIDTTVSMVAGQMPLSQQVAGWNRFLYQQVSDKYELRSAPCDHYFYPNEPVIILAERESQGNLLDDFARNGKAPRVPCRLDSNIVAASNTVAYPPVISNLASSLVTGIPGLSEVLESLAKESYLLTPELSDVVSAADLKAAAENNKTLHYNKVHDVELNDPPTGLTGKLPYYIAYDWRINADSFLPLFIWWEADYQYSQKFDFSDETYPSDFLNQFELDRYEVDLQPTVASMPAFNRNVGQPNFFSVHGLISLSSSSTSNLCGQIQIYCQTYLNYDPASGPPPPDLPDYEEAKKFYEAYQDYKTRNILSQGLSGFNPGLVQREQELQLPITVPRSWTNGPGKIIPLSKLWVTSFLHNESASYPVTWNDESINTDAESVGSAVYFNPFRAGFIGITKISLVDAFGRFVALKNPNPEIIAESMKSSQPAPADHGVYLAPRLLQPSRLSLDWISAASPGGLKSFTEPNQEAPASPVCGWVWSNNLDDSLMLYDESGIPLGSLRSRGPVLHWFPVPGETTQVGVDNQSQMVKYLTDKNANPVFKDFLIKFLYPDESSGTDQKFQNFLTVLRKSQQFIITASMQQDQALGVLMGRPLVVTQASLALEQKGLPFVGLDALTYPAWNQFGPQFDVGNSEYIPYNFDNFNQSGITNLKIPVRVGTAELQKNGTKIPYFDDGLAGYFMPGEWDMLYTPADVADTPGITSVSDPGSHPLSLSPDGSAATLTLLMDPRAGVHATTGILPVQSVNIPSDQYENILNQLEITFLSTPLVAAQDPPVIPLPSEQGFDWFWVEIGKDNVPLQPSQGNTDAVFPQHPLHLVDGWLKLKKGR
jgi:hypothetical protein